MFSAARNLSNRFGKHHRIANDTCSGPDTFTWPTHYTRAISLLPVVNAKATHSTFGKDLSSLSAGASLTVSAAQNSAGSSSSKGLPVSMSRKSRARYGKWASPSADSLHDSLPKAAQFFRVVASVLIAVAHDVSDPLRVIEFRQLPMSVESPIDQEKCFNKTAHGRQAGWMKVLGETVPIPKEIGSRQVIRVRSRVHVVSVLDRISVLRRLIQCSVRFNVKK